jgi:putative DNA primase/helicase
MIAGVVARLREGLKVFPCSQKKPLTPHGFKDATNDFTQVDAWWKQHPDAQIGVPTGRINNLLVLDVDGPKGAAWVQARSLPPTLEVETSPGHSHYWFRLPNDKSASCSAGVLAAEVDVRAEGGYIIAPPSLHHESGNPYRFLNSLPWAEAPAELLRSPKPHAAPARAADTIEKGVRHQKLVSIAGALRARGLSRDMVLAQLRTVNDRQCTPPLDDPELIKIADFVGSKPAGFPGTKPMETCVGLDIESFIDVKPEPLTWLWKDKIPLGKLTIFAGDPSRGKSLVTVDIAARLSRGEAFPDGVAAEICDSLFLSAEDDAADTVAPRLLAAGADVSRIHRVKAVRVVLSDGQTGECMFNFQRDIEKLDSALAGIPNTRLLVVDPVSAYLGRIDTHRDAEIRRVLAPLAELAARRKLAVIGVMHLKKTETSALLRVSGSIGFVAAARVVWGFGEDPNVPESRVMVPVKNNLAPLGSGLAYQIESDAGCAPHLVWHNGPVMLSADDALIRDPHQKRQRAERSRDAEQWLLSILGDGDQKAESYIEGEAKRAGFGWRTIQTAKKNLNIRSVKNGNWFWVLGSAI